MSCGAVIVLRRKEPGMVRPYKAWGYPVTPTVFVLFALWLLYNTAREQPGDVAMSTLLILAGLPLYWWQRRLDTRGAAASERCKSDVVAVCEKHSYRVSSNPTWARY